MDDKWLEQLFYENSLLKFKGNMLSSRKSKTENINSKLLFLYENNFNRK